MNVIKKIKILLITLSIIILTTTTVLARAGGGSSGGSSGSSSTSSSSSSSSSTTGDENGNGKVTIVIIIIYGAKKLIFGNSKIFHKSKIFYKSGKIDVKLRKHIKKLSEYDEHWNYEKIKSEVAETFYIVQEAWTKRNQEIAFNYCSENLNQNHKTKLDWMEIRNEVNILKDITLISSKIVGIEKNKNCIWIRINASMIDYIEKDNELISGRKKFKTNFYEYWRFIKGKDRWILDKIVQEDEVDSLDGLSDLSA